MNKHCSAWIFWVEQSSSHISSQKTMITVNELFQHCLIRSGMFIAEEDEIELNISSFITLLKYSLEVYNRYRPIDKKFNIEITDLSFTFLETSVTGIPEYLSTVTPLRIGGTPLFFFRPQTDNYELNPVKVFWEYRKPNLFIQAGGVYDIRGVYFHKLTEVLTEGEGKFFIESLSFRDTYFLDILVSHFMVALGRNRSTFILGDLPVTLNGESLISQGDVLLEKTTMTLAENSKWYLAWKA